MEQDWSDRDQGAESLWKFWPWVTWAASCWAFRAWPDLVINDSGAALSWAVPYPRIILWSGVSCCCTAPGRMQNCSEKQTAAEEVIVIKAQSFEPLHVNECPSVTSILLGLTQQTQQPPSALFLEAPWFSNHSARAFLDLNPWFSSGWSCQCCSQPGKRGEEKGVKFTTDIWDANDRQRTDQSSSVSPEAECVF